MLRYNNASFTLTPNVPSKFERLPLRPGLPPDTRMTASLDGLNMQQALRMYGELTGRKPLPPQVGWGVTFARATREEMSELGLRKREASIASGITVHGDGLFTAAEVKFELERWFQTNGVVITAQGTTAFRAEPRKPKDPISYSSEIPDHR